MRTQLTLNTTAYSDEAAVSVAIRNLVSHALKFSHTGKHIHISVKTEGESAHVSVTDSGIGMASEKAQELFTLNKKSEKGTAGEKGTGLGLILCKELVELNRGLIWAESALGEGSTFTFTLPLKK